MSTQPTQSDSLHIMGQCHCEPFRDCWYWVNVKDLGDAKDADTQLHKRQYKAIAAHYAAKEQEAVLRARIEEIEHIPYWGTPYGTDVFGYEKLFKDNRIFTLTNQLNQMKGEE